LNEVDSDNTNLQLLGFAQEKLRWACEKNLGETSSGNGKDKIRVLHKGEKRWAWSI
jgi:hypothetical protein